MTPDFIKAELNILNFTLKERSAMLTETRGCSVERRVHTANECEKTIKEVA